jgi:hypothetical protein
LSGQWGRQANAEIQAIRVPRGEQGRDEGRPVGGVLFRIL